MPTPEGEPDQPPVVAVVGPTATGKSDLALDLAEQLNAEIINADAMQFYRGMDIGTAKLPVHERRGIEHHQLDVLEVTEEASVATYQAFARADIEACRERGHAVVVVGGSGLYVRALLDRIDFPGTDPEVRTAWEERAAEDGPGVLHEELTRRDPEAAARIDRANTRRIVRALEVIEITGRPFSANLPDHTYAIPAVQIGLDLADEELDARIDQRARRMFAGGLAAETELLLEEGLEDGRTASRAVGYAQAIAWIHDEITEAEAIESTALATRQLARRQRKWFRRDPRITWLSASDPDDGPDLLTRARRLVG
ncbi:tRNA (adenosine(37)-N6)-dimethylallyltransferase MiaA [Ruania halotolerans]|uniref:tRNA (adenosine(37)-N6)-dimethylallyltransferase MiaA n=1 Tax=Ruania halotolerans TaxID=2897773 RepID=UPI001E633C29|nr:tRNA (adenosine(37)-N6)-dimethylallyltransferase MiaA [Ruania halotolerans]UFU05150.1 tRNA (adenosine(37)-N6)-dimethylallyltransferase MiaA [Ruania halotolerans]